MYHTHAYSHTIRIWYKIRVWYRTAIREHVCIQACPSVFESVEGSVKRCLSMPVNLLEILTAILKFELKSEFKH